MPRSPPNATKWPAPACCLPTGTSKSGVSTQATPTSRFQFSPGGTLLNSVRVTGRRTQGSAAGAVNLLFTGVFSVKNFQPVDVATSTNLDRDICLVLDRSGSMMQGITGKTTPTQSTDCKPPNAKSRWAALDGAVNSFLDDLQGTPQKEFVAMVSYGSDEVACGNIYHVADINSDLVGDYPPIRNEIKRIGSKPIQGHTAIGDGLADGIKVLTGAEARPFAVKTIILMTDGLAEPGHAGHRRGSPGRQTAHRHPHDHVQRRGRSTEDDRRRQSRRWPALSRAHGRRP